MPFVNEYMSEADIAKYGILEINRQFIRLDYKPHWTRDSQRDMYLRQVARGREEFAGQVDFTFFWQKSLYVLRLQHSASPIHLDQANGNLLENSLVVRLAEQYLSMRCGTLRRGLAIASASGANPGWRAALAPC